MAIVISDTSPIRALAHLGLLDMLGVLYGTVIVPPDVADELRRPGKRFPALDIGQYPFFLIRSPSDLSAVAPFSTGLHAGELAALALALELNADTLLIDERLGRDVARHLGIHIVGVLGVLLQAKQIGQLHAIRPLMDRLMDELDFRVSETLRAHILSLASEE
ncbi:MAG TPA: DUF3368 domain-containing protein [Tepidisphaeraceae bacterium]|nr:DUF3368 domain-containing protein [Tepidisphaeraceae bacterium]